MWEYHKCKAWWLHGLGSAHEGHLMTSSWHWGDPERGGPLIPLLCAWLASFSDILVFPPFQPHFPTKELRIQTQVFTVNVCGPQDGGGGATLTSAQNQTGRQLHCSASHLNSQPQTSGQEPPTQGLTEKPPQDWGRVGTGEGLACSHQRG